MEDERESVSILNFGSEGNGNNEFDQHVQAIKDELKKSYLKDMKCMPKPPWLPVNTENNLVVQTELEEDKATGVCERREIRYEDILKPMIKELKAQRTFLISGPPGIGKTTLLTKMRNDWATESCSELYPFNLVLFYQLRDLPKGSILAEVLLNYINSSWKQPEQSLENHEEKLVIYLQNKLLLLLDGFDEVDEDTQMSVAGIVKGKTLFAKSTVVVTSKVEHKRGFVEFFDRRILVVGIRENDQENMLKEKPVPDKKLDEILSYLKKPLLPSIICVSPLILSSLSYIFPEVTSAWELNSVSEIIIQVVKLLLVRHVKQDDFDSKIDNIIRNLGKYFFYKLKIHECVFSKLDLEHVFLEDWETVRCSGVIQPSRDQDMFEPLHKLFMDTLAAEYANQEVMASSVYESKTFIQNVLGDPFTIQIYILRETESNSYLVFRGQIDVLFYCVPVKTFVTEGHFLPEIDFTALVEKSMSCFQVSPESDELAVVWKNKIADSNSRESAFSIIINIFDSIINRLIDRTLDIYESKLRDKKNGSLCLHRKLSKNETVLLNMEYGESGFRERFGEEPFRNCYHLTRSLFCPVLRDEKDVNVESLDETECLLNIRVLQDAGFSSNKCRYQIVEL